MTAANGYVGRFAPSPTGPLHLGSLTTAVASYLHARQHQGQWRLRMDDLDQPRNQPGAADEILRALEQHQLYWDGPVIYQVGRMERYKAALRKLAERQLTFYCSCSRRMLDSSKPYPGTCQHRTSGDPGQEYAIRVRCGDRPIEFIDEVAGLQQTDIRHHSGDFIVWRRDGLPSYQLATATDDGTEDITHVLRGNDLLADTPRQLYLIDQLQGERPIYAHVPVLVDKHAVKLSKRTGAQAINLAQPLDNLMQALTYLGLPVPNGLAADDCESLLNWATQYWQLPTANQPNPILR